MGLRLRELMNWMKGCHLPQHFGKFELVRGDTIVPRVFSLLAPEPKHGREFLTTGMEMHSPVHEVIHMPRHGFVYQARDWAG
jgi:hypothetical protein